MESKARQDSLHPPEPPISYLWVDRPESFSRMMNSLRPVQRLAVDIEADSLYHYFEKVCLLQLSTEEETFLVDPLALKDLSPLGPLFESESVEKVLHAASYDLQCLRRDYGFRFRRIFDTQQAAQFLGYSQTGLDALLERLLGTTHGKNCQRDDWSRRPLTAAQLDYAARDTHHLLELRDLLEAQLLETGRLSWVREEFETAAANDYPPRDFDPDGFRRIKGFQGLSHRSRMVLRALYLGREEWAKQMDLPPFKVMNSATLVELSQNPPGTFAELRKRRGLSYRILGRFEKEILKLIRQAQGEDPETLPRGARRSWSPPSAAAARRLQRLRAWREAQARTMDVPVGVLFPGSLMELLAQNPVCDLAGLAAVEGMRAWRVREFGADLLSLLADGGGDE